MTRKKKRVLAVASSGGHWAHLLRVLPALEGCDIAFATVDKAYRDEVAGHRFYVVNDASIWNKPGLLLMSFRMLPIMLRERPDVVISTGAAPGFFAMMYGRWLRAKTIWIDSIANLDELSLSGRHAGKYADLWLTQWPHLAKPDGPFYKGSII